MKKISFFSYKGGSGRSTLAYNTIPYLVKKLNASPKNPILVFDLDVDSAGLTFLVKRKKDTDNFSIQEALKCEYPRFLNSPQNVDIQDHAIFGRCIPIGTACFGFDEEDDRTVLFMPTKRDEALGRSGDNYILRGEDSERFRGIVDDCKDFDFSAVLFDTPAGNQATAQWALEVSDTIVTCMRITYQMRMGTYEFLENKLESYNDKNVIIVPNAVPTDEIYIDGRLVKYEDIKDLICNLFSPLGVTHNNIILDMVGLGKDYFGVNEIKRFKVEEGVLCSLNPDTFSPDERKAVQAYKLLASLLAN